MPLPSTPLLGRHILVTRPRAQAERFAERLRESGAMATVLPAIAIVDDDGPELHDAISRLATYHRVIFTSANAVRSIVRLVGTDDIDTLRKARIFAIGPETAAALTSVGISPEPLPASADSESLFAALSIVRDERLLMPRSDLADRVLPDACRNAGAVVDAPIAYHTVINPGLGELPGLIASRRIDAITLASGSAARAVAGVLQHAGLHFKSTPASARPAVACIGETTASTARSAGLPVDAVARTHDSEGLITALIAWFAERTVSQ